MKSDESECPFCGTRRRARGAKVALGAAVVLGLGLSVAACGDDATPPVTDLGTDSATIPLDLGPDVDAGPDVDSGPIDAGMMPAYGIPDLGPEQDLGGPLPAYGIAPPDGSV